MIDSTPPPIVLAQHVVEQLGGTWSRSGGICLCPTHKDNGPSLSVREGRTSILVHCFAGCEASDIMSELRRRGLLTLEGPFKPTPATPLRDYSELARQIWSEARSLGNSPAARYLRRRHIRHQSAELRFHPALRHTNNGILEERPGLVARISNGGGLLAIQRIFLTPAGEKAPITFPKRGLGRPLDGAVRLQPVDHRRVLGIAEGTETAMSATDIFDVPTWAVGGTENFAHAEIPSGVRKVVLFLDNGAGGERAEALFRERPDIVCEIAVERPPARLSDWNDVARSAAADSARRVAPDRAAIEHANA